MILAIDQGTTGSTAVILNERGQSLGSFTSGVPQHFPRPGRVEHHPDEIWRSVEKAVRGVLLKTRVSSKKLAALASPINAKQYLFSMGGGLFIRLLFGKIDEQLWPVKNSPARRCW